MKPLHTVRILDLTRLLPGAVCTMLLRDLGAAELDARQVSQADDGAATWA